MQNNSNRQSKKILDRKEAEKISRHGKYEKKMVETEGRTIFPREKAGHRYYQSLVRDSGKILMDKKIEKHHSDNRAQRPRRKQEPGADRRDRNGKTIENHIRKEI